MHTILTYEVTMRKLLVILFFLTTYPAIAQFGTPRPDQDWEAQWISVPEINETAAGLYLFRKTVSLESVPETFEVYVSADNRYKLYVNEQLVSVGPALGDLKHWNYDTIDLAAFLQSGDNTIAVKVWNEGDLKAVAQFSWKTGLIMQGASEAAKILNTDDTWLCIQDKSYTPLSQDIRGYYAAGAGDLIDMQHQVKGWQSASFDDSAWNKAKPVFETETRGFGFRRRNGWQMTPSILPPMELTPQRMVKTRKAEGVSIPDNFPAEKSPVTVPANTTARILLDQVFLTNAYFSLLFSRGENSNITITYAEGLYDEKGEKGNRNDIEGKAIAGRKDSIISDGSINQHFTTLSYRTYRFVELKVETQDDPLIIEDVYGTFTGYPFGLNAKLETESDELQQMMEIGWRTARLCAVDTYMDCPFYERLQYVGDTRIQHFVSFYNSGDDRLAKNALNLMDNSRQSDGYTLSRYPDTQNQVIPTYSLWYVSMLYDYMMYGTDPEFVKQKLLSSRQIMNYFISYLQEDGSLKNVPGWNFTDWVPVWRFGTAPSSEDGSSALMDLQLLLALQSAVALEEHAGEEEYAALYQSYAEKLEKTIKAKYWDSSRKLFADTPDKDVYSQHANSLAILAGLTEGEEARRIGETMLADTTLAPASIYFKYYLHLALNEAGLGDDYLSWLDIWRKNMELGLTTWGETSQVESTRSDCHAWGSSPNVEFFRVILGIESSAPNFKAVRIEPHLGDIRTIGGEMPHPDGKISVKYDYNGRKLKAEITLPNNIEGDFVWNGTTHKLKGGKNELSL